MEGLLVSVPEQIAQFANSDWESMLLLELILGCDGDNALLKIVLLVNDYD